jgi:hypothetical protein
MNDDANLLFEAYMKSLQEKQEYNPWAVCTASVGRENKDKYEACVKGVKKQEDEEGHHCDYAAKGCECDGCEECKENAAKDEDAEYGVDPEEAAVYDKAKAEATFDNYTFNDAFHAVKEGAWTLSEFRNWASTVWSDGSNSRH